MAGCYAVVLNQPAGWVMLLAGLGFGFTALLLAINVGHDASHQVLPGGRRVNDAVQRLAFVLVGVDGYLWRLRHVSSHHLFPNVNGSDTDIDENPFVRLSPNQPWRPWFRWQHLYAPFAYSLAALYTTVWGDFVYLTRSGSWPTCGTSATRGTSTSCSSSASWPTSWCCWASRWR